MTSLRSELDIQRREMKSRESTLALASKPIALHEMEHERKVDARKPLKRKGEVCIKGGAIVYLLDISEGSRAVEERTRSP